MSASTPSDFLPHGANLVNRVLGDRSFADVIDDDSSSSLGESKCYGLTNSRSGPRNDSDFVL